MVMHDLNITIVEEQTKRLSRNLALTQTRHQIITFEDHQNRATSKSPSKTTATATEAATATATTLKTNTTIKPHSFNSIIKTKKTLKPIKNSVNSITTTTTIDVPYKNFKIWTDYDQDENLLLHIKKQKAAHDNQPDFDSRYKWLYFLVHPPNELLTPSKMLKSDITSASLPSTVSTNTIISTNTSRSANPDELALLEETCKKFPKLSISNSRVEKRAGMEWNRSLPESKDTLSLHTQRRAHDFRLKFRRSHTCGSLFAKCNCAINTDTIHLGKASPLLQNAAAQQHQQEEQREQLLLQNNNQQDATIEYNDADNLTMKLIATTNSITQAVTIHQLHSSQHLHLSTSPMSNTDISLASIMSNSGKRSTTSGFCSLSSQTSAATSAYLSKDESLNASFDYVNTSTTNTTTTTTYLTTCHDKQFNYTNDVLNISNNTETVDISKLAIKTNTSLSTESPFLSGTTQQSHLNNSDKNKFTITRSTSPFPLSDNTASKKDQSEKKLFTSYSHPDTSFVFTDRNKHAAREQLNINEETAISTRDGKIEFKRPKRSSSPNIGQYQILDVAVHPDILVKVSPKRSSITRNNNNSNNNNNSVQQRRRLLRRTHEIDSEGSTSESDRSLDNKSLDQQTSFEQSALLTPVSAIPKKNSFKIDRDFQSAQKYFSESGILGPLQQSSTNFIRKTSKILQDSQVMEQIRKTSTILRSTNTTTNNNISKESKTVNDDNNDENNTITTAISSQLNLMSPVRDPCSPLLIRDISTQCEFSPNRVSQSSIVLDDKDTQIKSLFGEIVSLKAVVKSRDAEIVKLRHEIHKLKSVLQQTTINHISKMINDEHSNFSTLLSPPPLNHRHTKHDMKSFCNCYQNKLRIHTKSLDKSNTNIDNSDHMEKCNDIYNKDVKSFTTLEIHEDQQHCNANQMISNYNWDKNNNYNNTNRKQVVTKKHGVSGESWHTSMQQNLNLSIPKYEKDYFSKHLIKEAIMDNDFLKNIDTYQVKELVDSMYELCIESGQYVIREGDVGAHLYVSAEGEFEVIKSNQTIGTMGPGKAFGELAILYNCTRTASIRVLSKARVWVLDRLVFQQIMMRTGMQRIEKSVNFLKSVPLLKNLSEQLLTKIADVLEVEFYPADTYIIRQGTKGDTFFLISQGSVKVTQKLSNTLTEKVIRTLERGDYFGERALIDEDKRTANIIALAPGVECLTLDRDSFTDLIGDLSELKEKSYNDESHVTITRGSPKLSEFNSCSGTTKAEYCQLQLTDLEVIATLGLGGFGRVELVKTTQQNQESTFALKCLKKFHIVNTKQEEHIFNERNILMSCQTPFICRMYRTFRDNKYVYMLMEPCLGGEIWTMLRDHESFSETATQFIVGCVLEAFEYLHARSIIYRDLKPENLMMDERGYIKLVDFGFAKPLNNSNKTWTFCGTPEYVAPEIILNKGHDRAVDYWALGILIHELLTGTPPFTANEPMQIYNTILKGIDVVDFPKHMSRASTQIIKRLCRDIPAERLGYQKGGIQDIKKHKWFLGFDWDGLLNQSLVPPFIRPIAHSADTRYFDQFPCDPIDPPDELSGWDKDF